MIKGKKDLKRYYNKEKIVNTYDAKRFYDTYRKLQHAIELEVINSAISQLKSPRLLEIAVGTGRVTKNIKGIGIGIDTSENMLKIAKKSAPKWKFIKMDVMNLKFKKKFNAIISLRLLRHFKKSEREIAYKKIYNSLSNNGLLIFDMPTGRHNKIIEFISLFKKQDKIYEADTPVKKIKDELNKSGFDVVNIYNTKYEGSVFRAMCILNDNLNIFYPLLRKYMEKHINNLHLAANVIFIARKQ